MKAAFQKKDKVFLDKMQQFTFQNKNILPTGAEEYFQDKEQDMFHQQLQTIQKQEDLEKKIRMGKKRNFVHWCRLNDQYKERKNIEAGNS